MKYVNELTEGEKVESVFAVTDKQVRQTKAGKPFLSIRLSDKTGSVDAVVWDNAEPLARIFEKGDCVSVRASAGAYNGMMQLTVSDIKKLPDPDKMMDRFLPTTGMDVAAMLAELRSVAGGVIKPGVKALLLGFLDDPAFVGVFADSPAAKGMHHVFLGGLLQHTLKVVRLSRLIADEYEGDKLVSAMIDRDLLTAGAMLHDIGKIEELSRAPGFDYTFKGRLIGHISLGLMALKDRLDKTEGVTEKDADLLMHMMISHHGELEYGSPKRPKTMEALILHYADNLDAKLQGLAEFADKDATDGDFTSFHRLYERYFYKGGR